jgi:mono/diheme cytochrome c family protein
MSAANCPTPPARLAVLQLAGLALAVGVSLAARADDSGASARAATDSADGGAQIYVRICQGCHMPKGEGAVGAGHYPKLAGNTAFVSWQYVALTVLNGKNGMPAFGANADQPFFGSPHLSDAQIADVVNYVRSHFGNRWKDKATSAQVAALPHPQ